MIFSIFSSTQCFTCRSTKSFLFSPYLYPSHFPKLLFLRSITYLYFITTFAHYNAIDSLEKLHNLPSRCEGHDKGISTWPMKARRGHELSWVVWWWRRGAQALLEWHAYDQDCLPVLIQAQVNWKVQKDKMFSKYRSYYFTS